jgi:serine/threonine protein kinase
MAETFEAVRRGSGGFEQRVCVKRVLPGYSTDAEFVRLFMREARLAAALSHRCVTRVVDFGEDRGCHYLALELVEGMDLRRLRRALAPRTLPLELAAFLAMEIAEALAHAHTRTGATGAVVHRDVSPANVLLNVDGDVKLTDFGISKALNDSPVTRTEFVRGNIWYMAPEQIEGDRVPDPRSDLFSLGIVLYECLVGRRPYQGPTDLATMMALTEGRRTPLREAAPDMPEPMLEIVDRLLEQRVEDRFQSAAAVAEALAPLTSIAGARRELGDLVRTHRHEQPKARARMEIQPVTQDLPREQSPVVLSPELRPRWTRYAVGPGAWASAGEAAARRRSENRPLPERVEPEHRVEPVHEAPRPSRTREANAESEVRLPRRSSLFWTALVLTLVSGLGLAACAASTLL